MVEPRASVGALAGYAWEESSESIAARLGIAARDVVRFDMNTVPWRLPAGVSSSESFAVNEYPDSSYRELVDAIAAYCGRPAASIVVGAGADELLSIVAQAYLDSTRSHALSDPGYSMFDVVSGIAGATPIRVASGARFEVDRDALRDAVRRADVTWLANPNNPTGESLPQDYVRDLARSARGLVVVDEAYAEFTGTSALEWIDEVSNVVVVRTLSKAFGLAGMRVGFALAAPGVVEVLQRVRPPGSITVMSAHLGARALGEAERMRALVAALCAERSRFAEQLGHGGRAVIEGDANFVLARLDPARAAAALAQGLVLRTYGPGHRLDGWSRITVRSPEENARLLAALA